MIQHIFDTHTRLLTSISLAHMREQLPKIQEHSTPLCLVWHRWVGKTTLMLQLCKQNPWSIYISADHVLVHSRGLREIVQELITIYDKTLICIDELHLYPNRKQETKNLLDSFPNIRFLVSGSNSISLSKWVTDLQRRLDIMHVFPLTFREFLLRKKNITLPMLSMTDLLTSHRKYAQQRYSQITTQDWEEYIVFGMYPFWFDLDLSEFQQKLYQTINKVILDDLPTLLTVKTPTLTQLKKLFYFVANWLPSDNNYSSLSKKVGINKDTLETVLHILWQTNTVHLLPKSDQMTNVLRKEFKIFVGNTNIYHALCEPKNLNAWTVREIFVTNALSQYFVPRSKLLDIQSILFAPTHGDLHMRHEGTIYTFEIWGKKKTSKQLDWIPHGYIIADDVLIWDEKKIPMWVFGCLG